MVNKNKKQKNKSKYIIVISTALCAYKLKWQPCQSLISLLINGQLHASFPK